MSKGNLLLIDDETMLLKHLRANLEDLADEVFTAENGVSALEIIAKQKIHCIVCDINMPKMNGIEVIRHVREQELQTPFIFYTGHGSNDLMNEASKYGAFDFLNKPNMTGLEEVVTRGLKNGLGSDDSGENSVESLDDLLKDL